MALDYKRDKILGGPEWETWKGLLRESHAHPVLIATIWQGYQNRYFSRSFGLFLQAELLRAGPTDVRDLKTFDRDREFICYYYSAMCNAHWAVSLPDYQFRWAERFFDMCGLTPGASLQRTPLGLRPGDAAELIRRFRRRR